MILIMLSYSLRKFTLQKEPSDYIEIIGYCKDTSREKSDISEVESSSVPDDSLVNIENNQGKNTITLINSESLGKGSLAVINNQYAPDVFYEGLCKLKPPLEQKYYISNSQLFISENIITHLDDMMTDYNLTTEKNNIVIYNTTDISDENLLYSTNYSESKAGYSFDIAIKSSYDDIIEYDGLDTEGWISENCCNYGFIIRYPEDKTDKTEVEYSPYHFRYVGIPHALIMKKENLCLEEYSEFIKKYSYENPLVYKSGDKEYNIYYTASTSPETEIKIPENKEYEISGNNYDGYIITCVK